MYSIVRSLSFLFSDDFEGSANVSVAIKSDSIVALNVGSRSDLLSYSAEQEDRESLLELFGILQCTLFARQIAQSMCSFLCTCRRQAVQHLARTW